MLLRTWWAGNRAVNPSKSHFWRCFRRPEVCSTNPTVTWIGHSSFLIQIAGMNIITDPIFGQTSILYPRLLHAGIEMSCIPPIDFVLISHNHRDHMDKNSLLFLKNNSDGSFLVPKGNKPWFNHYDFARVTESTWWESHCFLSKNDLLTEIKFTFLPANHWSQRGLLDKNRSLWGSWMIECKGHTIYFGGDTAYCLHFKDIADAFPEIHVALLPIGPCEPRAWVKESHLDAYEAGQAFLDLNAKNFIPMHWGTFPMGVDSFDRPVELIKKWWSINNNQLQNKTLHLPKFGEPILFDFKGCYLESL